MGLVMHVVLFVVAFLVWLPFVKTWDDRCYKQEHEEDEAAAAAATT